MTSEDVFVELLPEGAVDVRGAFLFTCADGPDTVLMCYPLEVRTVFYPAAHAYEGTDSAFWDGSLEVVLDGDAVLPFPLLQVDAAGSDSADFLDALSRYAFRERGTEGPSVLLVRPEAAQDSTLRSFDLLHRVEAVLACWPARFAGGDTLLVEISQECVATSDYDGTMESFAYPLVTGASWQGSISEGRISVVQGDCYDWGSVRWLCGVLMPPPVEETDWSPSPEEAFRSRAPACLQEMLGRRWASAVVWEFRDFEPVAAGRDFYAYFPDIGGVGTMDEYGLDEPVPWPVESPWASSFVYVFEAAEPPSGLLAIDPRGVPMLESPDAGAATVFTVPPGFVLEVIRTRPDWALVGFEHWSTGRLEGWVATRRISDTGLVEPGVIPFFQ